MPVSVFQIINFSIIILVFVFLIRYAWGMMFEEGYFPEGWVQAKKSGRISKELIKVQKNYADKVRFFNWWFQVERIRQQGVQGDFAELGVYKGESAHILHRMDTSRKFHLFDTFEGFKEKDLEAETGEAATYSTKNFADTNIEKVKKFIGGNENVIFHQGYFPDTCRGLEETRFALVNMDADLYNPTRAGLEFFYPRLAPGGVIIVHDYNGKWEGILKAVDEFAAGIPEVPALIPDLEGSIMILRSK